MRTDIVGADQIETFGAHMAAKQAHAGNMDFRLRRARDHGAVGIAHHDIAYAHRGAAMFGALDLRAADLDALWLPKLSSMAETSQGVKTSSWIGPLDSRHHRPAQPRTKMPSNAAEAMPTRLIRR